MSADFATATAQDRHDLAHEAAQVQSGAPLTFTACACDDGRHQYPDVPRPDEWVATRYAAYSDVLAIENNGGFAHVVYRPAQGQAIAA